MSVWQDWIGRSEQRTDVVTAGLVARLCATIDSDGMGDVAPQGIHWCLCLPDAPTAQLGEDGHPRRAGLPVGKANNERRDVANALLPPIDLPRSPASGKGQKETTRRMWASSKVAFHAPIAAGAAIHRTSTITDIAEKTGGSGRLVFVTLAHETRADGALAVREEQVLVYRGASSASAPIEPTPTPPLKGRGLSEDWPHARSVTPGEAMLMRYSALTFNAHRIHYDKPYATGVEGYAGLVVHGPLTATLLLDFAAQIIGHNRLISFDFRGVAPLFCGSAMTLVARREGGVMTLAALGPSGAAAMEARAAF
ncbi:MAG: MaoC family dehydratase N-terminal domain-containing protein [Pseudomonadota bacterium]